MIYDSDNDSDNIFNRQNIEGEEWKQTCPVIKAKVRIALPRCSDILGKIVIGQVVFNNGRKIFRLKEYDYCNAWRMDCVKCGLCPPWDDVVEIDNRDDVGMLEDINVEDLGKILFSQGFTLNFIPPKPIYILLNDGASPYFRAVYRGRGEIDIEGFNGGICKVCLKREWPYWEIGGFLPYGLIKPIKKRIFIRLIKYWFDLIRSRRR